MNWRSRLINILEEYFNEYTAPGSEPIQLKTVAKSYSMAIKPKDENLPAVSFGFGNNRGTEGGATESDTGIFQIYIYAEINRGNTGDKEKDNIIVRSGNMYECVERVVKQLRTLTFDSENFDTENGYVDIQKVRIADMRSPETKLSEKDFQLYTINVEYEEYLDELV